MPPPQDLRQPLLPKGVKAPVVVENVQSLVRDDRRQADRRFNARLALYRPSRRIDVDQRAFRVDDDQAVSGKHWARIADGSGLLLLMPEPAKLGDPARLAVRPGDAKQFAVVGDNIGPVADDPRGRNAGDIEFPLTLA